MEKAPTSLSIQQAIKRLFAKRGITWYRTELYSISSNDQVKTKKIKQKFIYPNYYIEQVLIMLLNMYKVEKTQKETLHREHYILEILLVLKY